MTWTTKAKPDVHPDIVAERLRVLQGESGMARAAWAKYIGASYQTVYKWLSGHTVPSYASLYRISRKTRVSVPWLLGEVPIDERGEDEL